MMMTHRVGTIWTLAAAGVIGLATFALRSRAAEPLAAAGPIADMKFSAADLDFFEKQVRPLLAENCFKCHGEKKQKGGLRLDARSLILKGGDHGAAVDVANLDKSNLLKAINYVDEDMQMPPDGKLPAAKIGVLTK